MTLPADWKQVTVRGRYLMLDGLVPSTGTVTLVPRLTSGQWFMADGTTIVPESFGAVLDANGEFEMTVPASEDPDVDPISFVYNVIEEIDGKGRVYEISIPHTVDEIDLATVAPVAPADPTYRQVRSVNGEQPDAEGNIELNRVTVASWEASRGENYFVAHRGSGDVIPEQSYEAFEHAVAAGAQCMEVSVAMTADGVLVVNHDLTWDRTVSASGPVAEYASTWVKTLRISNMAQCGPVWSGGSIYAPIPVFFEEILRQFGGKVVMCVEAKDNAAFPKVVETIERFGLKDSTIIKLYHTSPRLAEAKALGYKTFVYFDNASFTQQNIDAVVNTGHVDYLVVPLWTASGMGYEYNSPATIGIAVNTGLPVWVYPAHRRYDAEYAFGLGVKGVISSSYLYTSTDHRILPRSRWNLGAIAPGEVLINQADPQYAVKFDQPNNAIVLDRSAIQFVALGSYCRSVPEANYTVEFEASWREALPTDTSALMWLAWGREDDRYYQRGYNSGSPGNHAYVRLNGAVGLNRHAADGGTNGNPSEAASTALAADQWVPLRLEVTPTTATLTRTDTGASAVWTDSTNRGGYMHFGKTSTTGKLAIRNLVITT